MFLALTDEEKDRVRVAYALAERQRRGIDFMVAFARQESKGVDERIRVALESIGIDLQRTDQSDKDKLRRMVTSIPGCSGANFNDDGTIFATVSDNKARTAVESYIRKSFPRATYTIRYIGKPLL